jgi:hypothetical protein
MDIIGFIYALGKDWITLMSGVASVIFTVMGFIKHKRFQFIKRPEWQARMYWSMALLCFFFASVRIWTDEHKKVMDNAAYLQGTVAGVFSFTINLPIQVMINWKNVGQSPARNTRPYGKLYVGSDITATTQQAVVNRFKHEYEQEIGTKSEREYRFVFPGQSVNMDCIGVVLTKELWQSKDILFVVSAVRFKDASGLHEAHTCSYLTGITYDNKRPCYSWADCDTYVNQVDIE